MISTLVKQVMHAKQLTQADMAELTGSSLERIKAITSGRVAKLKPEEIRVFVQKLKVSAHWLATGEGAMFDESRDEFEIRFRSTNKMAAIVEALPLSKLAKSRITLRLTGDPLRDADIIAEALSDEPVLSKRESALIENYRHSPEAARTAMDKTGAALAQSSSSGGAGAR